MAAVMMMTRRRRSMVRGRGRREGRRAPRP
jgi:hypothetical protein